MILHKKSRHGNLFLMNEKIGSKGKLKISGSNRKELFFPSTSSSRKYLKTSYTHRSANDGDSAFERMVKSLLTKINWEFVHFGGEEGSCRLVIRIPNEKKRATSHTLRGTKEDIQKALFALVEQ